MVLVFWPKPLNFLESSVTHKSTFGLIPVMATKRHAEDQELPHAADERLSKQRVHGVSKPAPRTPEFPDLPPTSTTPPGPGNWFLRPTKDENGNWVWRFFHLTREPQTPPELLGLAPLTPDSESAD